jgi:replicative DNA helicase
MDIKKIYEIMPKFKDQNFGKIYTVAEMEQIYMDEYIPKMKSSKIGTGIKKLDDALGLIRPGQVVTIIAKTNIGKTAIMLHIARHNAKQITDRINPIFECELPTHELFERLVQMEHDATTRQVEEAYEKKSGANFTNFQKTKFVLPNLIGIIQRVAIEDVLPFCLACKELSGKELGFIGIDYLGLVKTKLNLSEYDRVTYVMTTLREIALHLDVPIINLSQPSRQDIKNSTEIGLHSGKSSGEVENSSQIVITLNRVDNTNIDKQDTLIISDWLRVLISKEIVYLIKAKIEKKKQGKYETAYLLYDTKSTVIQEYDPEFNPYTEILF